MVVCPSCSHKFSKSANRFLPKYIKVLRSTNRIELQFDDSKHLEDWLIVSNLECDKDGVPVMSEVERSTLADVSSTLPSMWSQQNSLAKEEETKIEVTLYIVNRSNKHFENRIRVTKKHVLSINQQKTHPKMCSLILQNFWGPPRKNCQLILNLNPSLQLALNNLRRLENLCIIIEVVRADTLDILMKV